MTLLRSMTLCVGIGFAVSTLTGAEPVSFKEKVAPLLLDQCVACHGAKKAEGGYRVDTFFQLVRSGDSGEPSIVASAADRSELYKRLVTIERSERMPAEGEPLTAEQIALIKNWIAEGAKFDGIKENDPLYLVAPPPTYPASPSKYPSPIPATAVAFSPDGKFLVVTGYHEITLWNVEEGTLARRIGNVSQRVHAIAFSPDGKKIAVGGGTPGKIGEVRWIDYESGKVERSFARTYDVVLDIAFRPDGKMLAVGSADSMIRWIDLTTFEETKSIASHADWVTAVSWSDDGSKFASASRDKSAKVFAADSGDLLVSYQGHAAAVRGVVFSADGKQIITSGSDHKLHRWEVEAAKKVAELGTGGEAYKLVRGDQFLLAPSAGKQVHRMDLATNKESLAYKGNQDWVLSTALHTPTNRVASGAFDGQIRVWNLQDGTLIKEWKAVP